VHLWEFPRLWDRVLSMCSDALIYLERGTCSPFQRSLSAFVSSCSDQGSEGVSALEGSR